MALTTEQFVADSYVSAVEELIQHYASATPVIVEDASNFEGTQLATVVGFAEKRLSGTSVLISDPTVAQALAGSVAIDAPDWLGELNNQVVGRLKNKLVRYGVQVQLSTPITTTGTGLGFGTTRAVPRNWVIRWDGGTMMAFLAMTVSPDLEFAPSDADEVVAEEGSLFLF